MAKFVRRSLVIVTALIQFAAADAAWATNGYFSNGYGTTSKGMAGAGVATQTDDVMGLAQNPALGVAIGNAAGGCVTFFSPDRSVTIAPGGPLTSGKFTSRNKLFLIPCAGANWSLSDRAAIGVHMFANGGMNTEYKTNFFAGFGAGSSPVGVNLEQVFLNVNYAFKATETLTFGIAPILAVQRFKATGLEAFGGLSANPTAVTNRGHDWSTGVGVNLGALYEPTETLRFGASFRPEINMSRFNKYSGLFAEGGDFDIPATATIGAAYTPSQDRRWTVTAEYQHIWYGKVPAIANTSAPAGIPGPLGASNGIGFGWKNMDVWRIGAEFRHSDAWTFRSGISYASNFTTAPNTVINTLAPATPKWHVSVGATRRFGNGWSMAGAYTFAFNNSIKGANPALTGVAQPVKLQMHQHEVTVGMNYRW